MTFLVVLAAVVFLAGCGMTALGWPAGFQAIGAGVAIFALTVVVDAIS